MWHFPPRKVTWIQGRPRAQRGQHQPSWKGVDLPSSPTLPVSPQARASRSMPCTLAWPGPSWADTRACTILPSPASRSVSPLLAWAPFAAPRPSPLGGPPSVESSLFQRHRTRGYRHLEISQGTGSRLSGGREALRSDLRARASGKVVVSFRPNPKGQREAQAEPRCLRAGGPPRAGRKGTRPLLLSVLPAPRGRGGRLPLACRFKCGSPLLTHPRRHPRNSVGPAVSPPLAVTVPREVNPVSDSLGLCSAPPTPPISPPGTESLLCVSAACSPQNSPGRQTR